MRNVIYTFVALSFLGVVAMPPLRAETPQKQTAPIYSITVVQRTLKAVNYARQAGPTRVDLVGTVLLPKAQGEVRVEVKNGYTEIDLSAKHVEPPQRFGTEFLTYVVWAISPDGHATNLGELIPNGSDKGKMRVTCPYSTFGLIVTAEPYFSVPYPSEVVVMENSIRPDTIGRVEDVEARYELLPRGQYTMHINPRDLPSAQLKNQPSISMPEYEAVLTLYEARNAVQIARADGAERYALPTFRRAQQYLNDAETQYARKTDFHNVATIARQAVQAASDARAIALQDKRASR